LDTLIDFSQRGSRSVELTRTRLRLRLRLHALPTSQRVLSFLRHTHFGIERVATIRHCNHPYPLIYTGVHARCRHLPPLPDSLLGDPLTTSAPDVGECYFQSYERKHTRVRSAASEPIRGAYARSLSAGISALAPRQRASCAS